MIFNEKINFCKIKLVIYHCFTIAYKETITKDVWHTSHVFVKYKNVILKFQSKIYFHCSYTCVWAYLPKKKNTNKEVSSIFDEYLFSSILLPSWCAKFMFIKIHVLISSSAIDNSWYIKDRYQQVLACCQFFFKNLQWKEKQRTFIFMHTV